MEEVCCSVPGEPCFGAGGWLRERIPFAYDARRVSARLEEDVPVGAAAREGQAAGQDCETAVADGGVLRPWRLCQPGRGAWREALTKRSEKTAAVNGNKQRLVAASALGGRRPSPG